MIRRDKLVAILDNFLKSIPDNLNYITPSELNCLFEDDSTGIFILDNRTPEAYKKNHIPNSINIPLREILSNKNLKLLPKKKKIVVCCWVGHTSSQVLTVLQLLGYDAIGLKYGYGESAIEREDQRGWSELGYPMEKNI